MDPITKNIKADGEKNKIGLAASPQRSRQDSQEAEKGAAITTNFQGVLRPTPKDEEGSSATRQCAVPINAIFDVEFKTLKTPPERQEEITGLYEQYVSGMMDAVSVWLGLSGASDYKKLASAVRAADEHELFSFMSNVFYKDFKASVEETKLLTIALESNNFNCYSSTVLFSDTLTRLGKELSIIFTPDHMFLAGERFALETTDSSATPAFPREHLDLYYPKRHEIGVEAALAATYDWCGAIFSGRGMHREALAAYGKALELDQEDASVWHNRGIVLHDLKRYTDSIASFDRALGIDQEDASIWYDRGIALHDLKMYGDAVASYDMALKIDPGYGSAWYNKGVTFNRQGRHEDAIAAFGKALEIDPKDRWALINKKVNELELHAQRAVRLLLGIAKGLDGSPDRQED
ncbi:MAG: tetratricopeptide repeat protein [Candidatus Micrarchaeota archaeon]|nr:tetratricopeptide repeat protein [Candidatus Micrarchaeota archaeon]